jgi:hypothetical protein
MLAGASVGLGLPLLVAARAADVVAGPRAVRLVTVGGKMLSGQWQAWADASLVPTVSGQVVIRLTGCPGLPRAAGCVYTKQPRVVYLKRNLQHPRGVMLHELGHVYDLTVLSNRDRGEFRRVMNRPHSQWWKGSIPLAGGSPRRTRGVRALFEDRVRRRVRDLRLRPDARAAPLGLRVDQARGARPDAAGAAARPGCRHG